MAARADITQTLSRGISILEVLAQSPAPLSTTDLADYLDVPRTNVNRLLNTLLAHDLISGSSKGWRIGAGIHKLADTKSQVVDETPDVLKRIANRLDMTAFLVHARNEMCVTLACAEIPREGATLVQRPGTVHSLQVGAPGIALLVSMGDRMGSAELKELAGSKFEEVKRARRRGWAYSKDEVIPGLTSVAVPVRGTYMEPTALAIVTLTEPNIDEIVAVLRAEIQTL